MLSSGGDAAAFCRCAGYTALQGPRAAGRPEQLRQRVSWCYAAHLCVHSMQEALRLATTLVGSWGEASPGELAQAPAACASTLGHILGSMQCLLACLEPAHQVASHKLAVLRAS